MRVCVFWNSQDLRLLRNRKALAIAPQWYQYRRKSHDLLAWLDDIQRSVDQLPDPPEGERVKVTKHRALINEPTPSHRKWTINSVGCFCTYFGPDNFSLPRQDRLYVVCTLFRPHLSQSQHSWSCAGLKRSGSRCLVKQFFRVTSLFWFSSSSFFLYLTLSVISLLSILHVLIDMICLSETDVGRSPLHKQPYIQVCCFNINSFIRAAVPADSLSEHWS